MKAYSFNELKYYPCFKDERIGYLLRPWSSKASLPALKIELKDFYTENDLNASDKTALGALLSKFVKRRPSQDQTKTDNPTDKQPESKTPPTDGGNPPSSEKEKTEETEEFLSNLKQLSMPQLLEVEETKILKARTFIGLNGGGGAGLIKKFESLNISLLRWTFSVDIFA